MYQPHIQRDYAIRDSLNSVQNFTVKLLDENDDLLDMIDPWELKIMFLLK